MNIEDYSKYSFVVRGDDTKIYKHNLKELGGKRNPNLKGGPGFIFPENKRLLVEKFINSIGDTKQTFQTIIFTIENPIDKTKVLLTSGEDVEEVIISEFEIVDDKVLSVFLDDGRQIVPVNGEWLVWGQTYIVEFK